MTQLKPNPRNLIGMIVLLIGLAVYALLIMQIGALIALWPVLVQALFYLVAGTIWLLPARVLFKWMGGRSEN